MQNGNFKPRVLPSAPVVSGFVHCVESVDSDGNSTLVPCKYPYDGLDGDSFDLNNQIEAGIPLKHVEGYRATGVHAADVNNKSAEFFIDSVESQKPKVPQVEGN